MDHNSKGNMHVIIIGNGIAGNTAAEAIRECDPQARITMISDEAVPLYSACVLPDYLASEIERQRVFLKSLNDYAEQGIEIILGQRAVEIDLERKRLLLENKTLLYDKLIIATGGKSQIPSIDGVNLEGVSPFKSFDDTERISNYVGKKAVVMGSGPIGTKASIALRTRGIEVSIALRTRHWVVPRVFDKEASLLIQRVLEEHGINILVGERIVKILGNGKVKGVITDKRERDCDMVVIAAGIRPDVELAQRAGIEIGSLGGIKVSQHMETNAHGVFACGDCVESKDMVTGKDTLNLLWPNAKLQGAVAGYNSVGANRSYPGSLNAIGIKAFGTHAVSVGTSVANLDNDKGVEIIEKTQGDNYLRLVILDGVLVGAQAVGKISDMGVLLSAALRREHLGDIHRVVNNRILLSMNPVCGKIAQFMNIR
ncbi:NAD(P)/FAD-dependent oxidoreductase [Chloroflexota bacterium]